MSALISTISSMLKNRYLGPLRSQVNNEVLVTQLFMLDSKNIDLDGNQAVVPLHHGRSTGIGARLEMEALPAAGNQGYNVANFDLAYLYGRAQFSGQAVQKTKTDAGAFIRVITDELDRLRDDLGLDLARQFYGDGTGTIAVISSGTASATQTLTSAESVEKGFLYPGMIVDIGTLAAPRGSADSATIASVSSTTVVFTASVTTTTSDVISREDNLNNSSVSKEITGFAQLFSTAANTVGGIDASAAVTNYWDNLRDTGGGAIALSNLMLNSNKINAKGAKNSDIVVVTTPGILRRLWATSDFSNNVRFVNSTQMAGGFSSITFESGAGSYSISTDRLAPWGRVYMVDKSALKVYSPGDWDYLDRDGLTIRWVDNRDAFQAVLVRYLNLGVNRRNTSLVMSGITDTNGY